jgi:hypothetical protein
MTTSRFPLNTKSRAFSHRSAESDPQTYGKLHESVHDVSVADVALPLLLRGSQSVEAHDGEMVPEQFESSKAACVHGFDAVATSKESIDGGWRSVGMDECQRRKRACL